MFWLTIYSSDKNPINLGYVFKVTFLFCLEILHAPLTTSRMFTDSAEWNYKAVVRSTSFEDFGLFTSCVDVKNASRKCLWNREDFALFYGVVCSYWNAVVELFSAESFAMSISATLLMVFTFCKANVEWLPERLFRRGAFKENLHCMISLNDLRNCPL